jgi:hypothetical protein
MTRRALNRDSTTTHDIPGALGAGSKTVILSDQLIYQLAAKATCKD